MDEFRRKPTPWTNLPPRPMLTNAPPQPSTPVDPESDAAAQPHLQPSQSPQQGSGIKIIPPSAYVHSTSAAPSPASPIEPVRRPIFMDTPELPDNDSRPEEQTEVSHNTEPVPVDSVKATRKLRKPVVFGMIAFIVLVVAGGAGVFMILPSLATASFSTALKQSVSFPLYYPVTPPAGYKVDQKSLANQSTSGLIYFVLRNGSKSINISEQANPNNSYVITVYTRNLTAQSTVSTPYGTATMGMFSGRISASLLTDKTWLIVSATPDVSSDAIVATLKNIKLDH